MVFFGGGLAVFVFVRCGRSVLRAAGAREAARDPISRALVPPSTTFHSQSRAEEKIGGRGVVGGGAGV